jgi:hypothetical protein
MNKGDQDIRREKVAHEINARLVGAGVSVAGGGSRGPYSVTVDGLDSRELGRVLKAVLAATGGQVRE